MDGGTPLAPVVGRRTRSVTVAATVVVVAGVSSSSPSPNAHGEEQHEGEAADDGDDADHDRARQLAALLLLGLLLVLQLAVGLLPFTLLGSHERRRLPAPRGAGRQGSQAPVVVDADVPGRLEQADEADRPGIGIDGEPQAAEVGEVLVDGAGVPAHRPEDPGVGHDDRHGADRGLPSDVSGSRRGSRPAPGHGADGVLGTLAPVAIVRMFASAREAAGTNRDDVPGATVGDVLGAARSATVRRSPTCWPRAGSGSTAIRPPTTTVVGAERRDRRAAAGVRRCGMTGRRRLRRARPATCIKARRRELQALDDAVSYVRRVAQGRADLARAELARRGPGDRPELVDDLAHVLGDRLLGVLGPPAASGRRLQRAPPVGRARRAVRRPRLRPARRARRRRAARRSPRRSTASSAACRASARRSSPSSTT